MSTTSPKLVAFAGVVSISILTIAGCAHSTSSAFAPRQAVQRSQAELVFAGPDVQDNQSLEDTYATLWYARRDDTLGAPPPGDPTSTLLFPPAPAPSLSDARRLFLYTHSPDTYIYFDDRHDHHRRDREYRRPTTPRRPGYPSHPGSYPSRRW
ncbi:MAG: hypothetical protein AB7Q00_01460 [Phycisphaerales bacterium]|nr:MAG: hypothetical protein IPK69_06080 [Phycisphaerales bacterium]